MISTLSPILTSLPLTISAVTILINLLLGAVVYLSNPKSTTNKIFILLSFSLVLWEIANVLVPLTEAIDKKLLLIRLVLFFAVLQVYFLFLFTKAFPGNTLILSRKDKYLSFILTALVAGLTLTPFVFMGIKDVDATGIPTPVVGPTIVLFGLTVFYFIISSIYGLFKRYKIAELVEKKQINYLLIALVTVFSLFVLFNFIIVTVFKITFFINFNSIILTVFVILLTDAIIKSQLFNIKVVATELLIFALWVFILIRTFISTTTVEIVSNAGLFVITVIVGIWLIRSVLKEVRQREEIQAQATQLESFIHFLSHEVKGILGKNRDTYQALTDGDFGELPTDAKPFVGLVLHDTNDAIDMVMNILHSTDFKSGKMQMQMQPFDLKQSLIESIDSLKREAEAKGLSITQWFGEEDTFMIVGDKENITKHVIRNLIDNAIKYTPKGTVVVRLEKKNNKALLSIKDSGIGITPEDKKLLFTEGGRGKDSVKVNVHSTGFGLFFSKSIIDAHHGRIWAESEGMNQGSTFFVELPLK